PQLPFHEGRTRRDRDADRGLSILRGGPMTNLTFYGGVGEIGGNKVLVEDRDARIWLDMGATFDFGSDYFVEYLMPRERFGLRDYFALGDRKSTRLNSSHVSISYAVFCLKKKKVDYRMM